MPSILERFPLRLVINGEDLSFELDEGFTFSSTDPGGFEAASFPLPYDEPQIMRGDPVRLECGLSTAWEGRVKEVQRSLGAKTLVQCEGNRAALAEATRSMIYVDRDLTRWHGPSTVRLKKLAEEHLVQGNLSIGPDAAQQKPAVILSYDLGWESPNRPIVESFYDSGGLNVITKVYYDALNTAFGAGTVSLQITVIEKDDTTGVESHSENLAATENPKAYFTATTPERYSYFQWRNTAATAAATGATQDTYLRALAVYGNHGLAGRGSDPVGYYPSDIVGHALGTLTAIKAGIIEEATQYTVTHYALYVPTPVEQIISDMARFAGWHWGVWDSTTYLAGDQTPRLDFRARPAEGEPTAWAWRQDCNSLDIRESLENLYDSAKVTYTEPSGLEGTVEVSRANPALEAAGLHRQVALTLGAGTQASAEAWGLIQLRLLADQARMTGSASITDAVHTMNGADRPAWLLRAGLDRLRIPDLPCSDVWGEHNDLPITRVECSGSASGITTSVEFGLAGNLIETLAAQLQANITAAG